MSDLLAQAADRFSRLVFLDDGESKLSFSDAERMVEARARNLPSGERIGIRPSIALSSVIEILAITRAKSQAVLIPLSWPVDLGEQRLAAFPETAGPETVVFTSGSAGAPKAVRLTESNWSAAGENSSRFFGFEAGRRWLLVLPLFHVGGLAIVFRSLCSGGCALLAPRLTDHILDEVDFASLVPAQLDRVVERRPPARAAILIGGGFLREGLTDKAKGWTLHRTYGMTETAAVVASGPAESEWMKTLPGLEIKEGDDGRLLVRGAQVSSGYVGEADRSPGDFLRTADLGKVRGDEIALLGRADRVINTGGEKVDPATIERLLESFPGVIEVAAFGVPDEDWGEVVAVVYVGSALADDLVALIERRLGPISRPRFIRRVESLPRNALGKVDFDSVSILRSQGAENRHRNAD